MGHVWGAMVRNSRPCVGWSYLITRDWSFILLKRQVTPTSSGYGSYSLFFWGCKLFPFSDISIVRNLPYNFIWGCLFTSFNVMAEILGVVASGITVVQVAVQLLDAVQKLRSFYRSMRHVPEYLQSTLNDIEMLGRVLDQLETFDDSAFRHQGSSMLQDSLLSCQAATSALKSLTTQSIQRLNKKGKLRSVYLLKAFFQKEDMEELKRNLETTKRGLEMVMNCYTMYNSSPSHSI